MTTPKDKLDIGPIEVITSVQRRRRWGPEEKRANRLENARMVLEQLPAWFEDYNEVHPHKGCGCGPRGSKGSP